MKTDTEYFRLAVESWCKKHKWERDLPVTPSWFSQMLTDAQALKQADKDRISAEGAQS